MRPRLLDLFSGAGGAAMGYYRAGFEVVGVDIKPQKHYPFEFHQGDALTYPLEGFDAYHASPPCQRYSSATPHHLRNNHPDLVGIVRELLLVTKKPFVIENVKSAPLKNYMILCGTMFGKEYERHRHFECNPPLIFAPCSCNHWLKVSPRNRKPIKGKEFDNATHNDLEWSKALLGIDWMTSDELRQVVPPIYTEYIGKYLMQAVLSKKETNK